MVLCSKKKEQRWLWSAWSPQLKKVLAYHLGKRTNHSCQTLLRYLTGLPIRLYCTDDWGAYQRYLPEEKHLINKRYTQTIERNNLNFRTQLRRLTRKTICFSVSKEVHDKVVGEFINRHYFQLF